MVHVTNVRYVLLKFFIDVISLFVITILVTYDTFIDGNFYDRQIKIDFE